MITLVKISPGNDKTGRIPAVSLSPILSCAKDVPCRKFCYAKKVTNYSPDAKRAYQSNFNLARKDLASYFDQIDAYLMRRKPKFFRWHVSGDFLSQTYVNKVFRLAEKHPKTKFLAFTKRYGFDYSTAPANVSIVFSMWTNYGDTTKDMPRAWMLDTKEPDNRIPADAINCPGNCETCGMCWNLKHIGKDVYFHKH